MSFNKYLPITVVAAIAIFLMKELLEYRRRRSADRKKIAAYKRVLARECERLGWVLAVYKNVLEVIFDSEVGHEKRTYSISRGVGQSAELIVDVHSDDNGSGTDVYPIYAADRTFLNKLLIDIAALDDALYLRTERAHDALGWVGHFQEQMIEGKNLPISLTELERLQKLAERAQSSIEKAETEIFSLYKHCTGKVQMDLRRY